jgi:hypothetical protein
MTFTRVLFTFDLLVALVIVGFFVVGLGDGSVSSFNAELWFGMLAALAAVIGGGWALQANGQRVAAVVVLLILAVPALLYVLFFAMIIIMQPRWN